MSTATMSIQELRTKEAELKAKQFFYYEGKDCLVVDEMLKKINQAIVSERNKKLAGKGNDYYINALVKRETDMKNYFAYSECRDKIEKLRLTESAKLITEQAIASEQQVLGKNYTEQTIYFGIGAVVLITGLYIILKK